MARSFLIITLLPAIFASVALGAPVKKDGEVAEFTEDWDQAPDHTRLASEFNTDRTESPDIVSQVQKPSHLICKEDRPNAKPRNGRRGNGFCTPVSRPSNKPFMQPNSRPVLRPTIDPNPPTLLNRLMNVDLVDSITFGQAPNINPEDGDTQERIKESRLRKRGEEKEEKNEEPEKVEEEEVAVAEDDSEDWDAYMEQLILTRKKAEDFGTDEDFARSGKIEWAQDGDGKWKFIKKEE